MFRRLLLVLALVPLGYLAYCSTHIPTASDHDAANQVAKVIVAGYRKFDNRQAVERTGKGKIFYVSPGSNFNPTIIFYEITAPAEIEEIEGYARQALAENPHIQTVSLHFFKEQNLSFHAGGSVSRGWETAFKKVTIKRH